MMMNEFTERTGIEPNAEEYAMIEEMYYEFDGDKNAFCKDFVKKNRMLEVQREIVAAVREKVEQLRKDSHDCTRRGMPFLSQIPACLAMRSLQDADSACEDLPKPFSPVCKCR